MTEVDFSFGKAVESPELVTGPELKMTLVEVTRSEGLEEDCTTPDCLVVGWAYKEGVADDWTTRGALVVAWTDGLADDLAIKGFGEIFTR